MAALRPTTRQPVDYNPLRHSAGLLGRPQGQVTAFKVLLRCDRVEEAVQLRQDSERTQTARTRVIHCLRP
ncbi:hypothetical protein AMK25_29150 [Micromonospora sp. TSRI0369]|nr:hypothetical protein AMK25_29150 [Micromonospora sp. TSRI0369]